MNKLKEDIEIPTEAAPEKQEKAATNPPAARKVMRFLDGSFMTKENVVEMLPFLLFVSLIGILYIGNRYYSEKNVFRMNAISNELKELRSEYITTKSELMFKSKQSEVAKAIAETGLKESVVPPKKIVVTKEELNTK
ncbi:MAG: FtsL-like putative cell division protein [Bacteroidia bacterium]